MAGTRGLRIWQGKRREFGHSSRIFQETLGFPINPAMAETFPSPLWGDPPTDPTWIMPPGAVGEGTAPLVLADPGASIDIAGPHIPPQTGGGFATLRITTTIRTAPGCAASFWTFNVGITSPFNPGTVTQVNLTGLGSGEANGCVGNIGATPANLVSGLTWDFNNSAVDIASPGDWRRSHTQFIFPRDNTQEYDFLLRLVFNNGPLPTGAFFVVIELDGSVVT